MWKDVYNFVEIYLSRLLIKIVVFLKKVIHGEIYDKTMGYVCLAILLTTTTTTRFIYIQKEL